AHAVAGTRGEAYTMSTLPLPASAARGDMSRVRLSRHTLGLIGAIAILAAWEISARLFFDPQVLPAPTQAIAAAWNNLTAAELAQHVGWSLWRIVAGFALGAVSGIALGVASGWYAWLARIVRPVVELLRPIPPLAWIPIAIVWFGL